MLNTPQAPQQQPQAPQQPQQPQQAAMVLQAKMQDPKFSAWFNSQSPEQQQQVLAQLSTDYKGQGGVANDQLAIAQGLRSTPSAEGRQAGRVYVAANPLEHIASAYKQRQGLDQEKTALARKKELSDMQGQGLQSVMASMLRNKQGA